METERRKLAERFVDSLLSECPECHAKKTWTMDKEIRELPMLDFSDGRPVKTDQSTFVHVIFCKKCGYMKLFAAEPNFGQLK